MRGDLARFGLVLLLGRELSGLFERTFAPGTSWSAHRYNWRRVARLWYRNHPCSRADRWTKYGTHSLTEKLNQPGRSRTMKKLAIAAEVLFMFTSGHPPLAQAMSGRGNCRTRCSGRRPIHICPSLLR